MSLLLSIICLFIAIYLFIKAVFPSFFWFAGAFGFFMLFLYKVGLVNYFFPVFIGILVLIAVISFFLWRWAEDQLSKK